MVPPLIDPPDANRQRAGIGDGGTGEGETSADVKIATVANRLGIERIAAAGIERAGNVQRAVLDRGAGQVDRAAVGDRAAADRGAALHGKAATDVYAATIVDRLGVERIAAAADIERPRIRQRAVLNRAAGQVERAAAGDSATTNRSAGVHRQRAGIGDGATGEGETSADVKIATVADRLGIQQIGTAADIEHAGNVQRAVFDCGAASQVQRAAIGDGGTIERHIVERQLSVRSPQSAGRHRGLRRQ